MRADVLSRRSDYESKKVILKQFLTEKNEALKLTECVENKERIIKEHHELRDHGHSEVQRTYEKIMRKMKGIKKEVTKVLKKCTTCIKIKKSRKACPINSIAIETSKQSWQVITINFVTRLSLSIQTSVNMTCDNIMTVIDKFIKYVELISTRTDISAEALAHILIDWVIKNHEMPKAIIFDKDKLFIFNFWEALTRRLKIKRKMSISFHSQTNDQFERTNQTVEQYLRAYVLKEQTDWTDLLFTAQLTLNNCVLIITDESPFLLTDARHSVLSSDQKDNKNSASTNFIKDIVRVRDKIMKRITKRAEAINRNSNVYDLRKEDLIYLKITNIDLGNDFKKLAKTAEKLFKITHNIKERAFELKLFKEADIFSIFKEELLIKADPREKTQQTWNRKSRKDEYTIERILKDKIVNGKSEFLIKWKGYDDAENTWEFFQNLVHCKDILREYYRREKEK